MKEVNTYSWGAEVSDSSGLGGSKSFDFTLIFV